MNPLETHAKVIGILHLVLASVGLLACFFLVLVGAGILAVGASGPGHMKPDDQAALSLVGVFVLVAAAVTALFAVPDLVVGLAVLRRRTWARVGGITLACFHVLSFPLGTALGVYTLVMFFKPEALDYFNQ